MRISLFLLVAAAAVADCYGSKYSSPSKRDLLVRSKRRWVLSTIELEEEKDGQYPMEISVMYNDKTQGKDFRFRLSGEGVPDVFTINENTGAVFAHKKVDREQKPLYHINFDVLDRNTGEQLDKELAFDVEIQDINDNPPKFSFPEVTVNVKENIQGSLLPVTLVVTDKDKENTANSEFNITMVSQTPAEPKIAVQQLPGGLAKLTLKGCFDYDKATKYTIVLQAKDRGTKPKTQSSTAVVTLNIVDANTHQPRFKQRQYNGEAIEMETIANVLRVAVEDKDTPNTDAWRAKYSIIAGNEEGIYKIETDPETNEGVLSIVKKKNFERTTSINLQIGVKNIEDIFVCAGTNPPTDRANVTLKMIDTNDPPEFEKAIDDMHLKEEAEPGKVLFKPKVHDVDSNIIRYVLLTDPADWVAIDTKTGEIKSTKRMDRESRFVDDENVYTVVIAAIDDGQPPATSTCTVRIHLTDINDNTPKLVNNSAVMCGNKVNKVKVHAKDLDAIPYSGPFHFTLGDETQKQQWKIEPDYGEEVSLVSQKTLPYLNYSIPLVIMDQQGIAGLDTLQLTVCQCDENDVCRDREPLSTRLGPAGIGLVIIGLLAFLLLLIAFFCKFGPDKILPQDEGNQTLIQYNQEGGCSPCMTEPNFVPSQVDNMAVTNGQMDTMQIDTEGPYDINGYNSSASTMFHSLGMHQQETYRSHGMRSMAGSSIYQRSFSLRSADRIEDHINRRCNEVDGNVVDHPTYQPHSYAFEGDGSICQSLDKLSFHDMGEDFKYLDDLGPKFKTLGQMYDEAIKKKKVQL
ncbi:cadherin-like protein 26 [Pundamilia nyererei]|uniref:Cadherin-like protein 26 n=1 Tax=Pundamilia nyererei TaxID=303518 RepID=A0A9Y6JCL1_9CICH|nr:PREDICTED: cadherin-like protein 26 [Pundamilia nyererei]